MDFFFNGFTSQACVFLCAKKNLSLYIYALQRRTLLI